jgi:hypothetical protein
LSEEKDEEGSIDCTDLTIFKKAIRRRKMPAIYPPSRPDLFLDRSYPALTRI